MSQPPGPYGQYLPPSPSGPYGPPAPYGQPAGGYPPGGSLPPPKQNNVLPWIIVGSAVLLSGIGLLIVVLLTGDDSAPTAAVAKSAATTAEPADTPSDDQSGAAGFSSAAGGDEPRYAGSPDAAIAYMDALLARDNQKAYDLACEADRGLVDVLSAATGTSPPDVLAQTVYDQKTHGEFMTGGTFDGLSHDIFSSLDQANFTVQLESGDEVQVQLDVDRDLGVCGIA
jgi:hypothetical protein